MKRQKKPCKTSAGVWLDDVELGVQLLDLHRPVLNGPLRHMALPLPEAKLHGDKRQVARVGNASVTQTHRERETEDVVVSSPNIGLGFYNSIERVSLHQGVLGTQHHLGVD